MNDRESIFQTMKSDITALESNPDDFETASHALSLVQNALNLLETDFGHDRLRKWQSEDDPAFDRFASRLKNALERQRDYLHSITDVLSADADVIFQKITASQSEIEALLEREDTVLRQGDALFQQETRLKAEKERLDALLARKAELEAAQETLAQHDPDALTTQIQTLDDETQRLESERAPLLERKNHLEETCRDLRTDIDNLQQDIDRLETAYGPEAAELAQRVPHWVEKLKTRVADREEKAEKYLQELETESNRYNEIESQLQQHLRDINAYTDAIDAKTDILQRHFEANKDLAGRFSGSIPEARETLDSHVEEIETNLGRMDRSLEEIRRRIQETAGAAKPMGIGA